MSCCPPTRCAPAFVKGVEGKGSFSQTGDFETYTVGDKSAKKCILMMADIYNFKSGRHVGICDAFAECGYYVVMPDLFNGTQFGEGVGLVEYITANSKIEDVQKKLDHVYEAVIPSTVESIGAIGFCIGCWFIFNESARSKPTALKCGVNCHPSVQVEGIFGRDVDALCRKINHPMMLMPCEGDVTQVQPGTFLEKEKTVEMVPFPTMQHGFVSQGDVEQEEIKKNVEQALSKACEFFAKYL